MFKIDKKRRMDDTKMIWHMDRVHAYFERGERIAPIYIDMGITKACNIRCVYCYGVYQNLTGDKIRPDVLIRFFEDAPKLGVKAISITGDGEPTLNSGLWEALETATKNGLETSISTNGLLLNTDSRIDCVLRNCTWMRFNISAGTKEGYKKIHTADAFDKLIPIIKRTVEMKKEKGYKCDIGLQTVFVPWLMNEEVIKLAELAVNIGVDYLVIKQCSLPVANIGVNEVEFNPRDSTHPDVVKVLEIAESMATPSTDIVVKWVQMLQQQTMSATGKRSYDGCLAPPFLLQISGNGKLYPCGHLFGKEGDKFVMGDLHKNTFKEILESDQYWNMVKQMQEYDVHHGCFGQCRLDGVNEFLYDYTHPPMGVNFI